MNKKFPQRKSPRLQGYDYSQSGLYFVTICTQERYLFFGDVVNGVMQLSPEGQIAQSHITSIPSYWDNVDIDYFVVMPNHVHFFIIIYDFPDIKTDAQKHVPTENGENVGTAFLPSGIKIDRPSGTTNNNKKKHPPTLGQIIGNYKSGVTREVRKLQASNVRLWQSRYYDSIIRSEKSVNILRQYVLSNPAKWEEDEHYKETYL